MADTSIYSRFMPPERSMQDYLDEADARDQRGMQNKLNTMMLQDKQRGYEEANQLRALYAQPDFDPSTPEAVRRVMRVSPTQGFALQKGQLEALEKRGTMAKADAETQAKTLGMANDRYKAWQTTMGALAQQPNLTKDMALQTGQQLVQMGIMTPEMFQGAAAKLPDDPAQLRQQILTGLKTQLTPEQMLTIFAPKVEFKDNGQQLVPVQMNPNAPGYKPPVAIQKLQSPDNAATVGASLANAAATRDAARTQADATRDAANSKRDQDTEMKLADDYRTQSKDFKESTSAYQQIKATLASATKSPAATLAAATKFMKILDPGSVVRESELGMALAASGVIDRAQNYINILKLGKVLTETQAKDFNDISEKMYGAAQQVQRAIDADYTSKAKTYNLRPEMVTQDLGQNAGTVPPAVAAALARHGSK